MELRDKIIEAATRIYCEAGFRGTTTRRIAAEAGVNEVTVFRQFGSKEALLREAIGRQWAGCGCPMPPGPGGDPFTELLAWARAYTDGHRQMAPLIRTRMGEFEEHPEMVPGGGSPPARSAQALVAYLEQLRDDGIAKAEFDPAAAAAMLTGALFTDAIARQGLPDMFGANAENDIEEYVRLFLRGIGVNR